MEDLASTLASGTAALASATSWASEAASRTASGTASISPSVDAEVVYAVSFCALGFALCVLSFLRIAGPLLVVQLKSRRLAKLVRLARSVNVPVTMPLLMLALFCGVWYKDAVVWFGRLLGLGHFARHVARYL
jgi:hypothetical protein